jgi:hypothetical protein
MRLRSLSYPILALAIGVGCSSIGPAGEVRVPGSLLGYFGDSAFITLPARAQVGAPVTIRASTFGDGCYRQGETDVSRNGLTAEIAPFDYRQEGDVICTRQLREFPHEAVVTFDTPGQAVITIRGVEQPDNRPVVLTRYIVIE